MIQKSGRVHTQIILMETNALQGSSLNRLCDLIRESPDIDKDNLVLKGNPPLGTCALSVSGKRNWLETSFWCNSKA